MDLESIISITIAAIGVGISILAFIEAKRANKAVLQQNREKELADIDKEIVEIKCHIEKLFKEGEEKRSHTYGIRPNPNLNQIKILEEKMQLLLNRRKNLLHKEKNK